MLLIHYMMGVMLIVGISVGVGLPMLIIVHRVVKLLSSIVLCNCFLYN